MLLIVGFQGTLTGHKIENNDDLPVVLSTGNIEIVAGEDFYLKFNASEKSFEKQQKNPAANELSNKEKIAVAKAPIWIQRKLIEQFKCMNNSDAYVDLILSSQLHFTDEIAFTIACSPLGNVPPVDLIYQNVEFLYQIDSFIDYADIVDYDLGNNNYYSTIKYTISENNSTKDVLYPMDVYYWQVVHPRINREEPMLVYNKTWREYLFYHNDVGHPLVKEQVADDTVLWDGVSHTKDTGVHAVQYWMSKNIRYEIIGDRPGQPSTIAHEHTGYCGESQKLGVAVFRAAMIPTIGVMNYAEDHVWSEFYERGWIHYDGAINRPYMYTDGWGKDMSSIWAWKSDSSIYDVTKTYLHPEERITATFQVTDAFNNPVDGAVVVVFVKGLKDITWYKDYVLDIIDAIWDKLPDVMKITLLERMYNSIYQKIEDIDEVIDTYQVSIWNHTDTNGMCQFTLGSNDQYIFLIQKPNIDFFWPLYRHSRIRLLVDAKDTNYSIRLPDFSNNYQHMNEKNELQGQYHAQLEVNLSSYQLQRNVITTDIGTYPFVGSIDFFIVDESNFQRYKNGQSFDYAYYHRLGSESIDFSFPDEDYYLVFRNHAQMTNTIMDYTLHVTSTEVLNTISIGTPNTDMFSELIYTVGTRIDLSGIAPSEPLTIAVNNNKIQQLTPVHNKWLYQWNTTGLYPGEFNIRIENEHSSEEITIHLIDTIPPQVQILTPRDEIIVENEQVFLSGLAFDNVQIKEVLLKIDTNQPIQLDGKEKWSYILDSSILSAGEHQIKITAFDIEENAHQTIISLVKNQTSSDMKPRINTLFTYPEQPINTSIISVYCNVTSNQLFSIKKVVLFYEINSQIISKELFRYGDNPPQERHVEDDIQYLPNDPIYGIELGTFQTNQTITYWVEAIDTADNHIISEKNTITIR